MNRNEYMKLKKAEANEREQLIFKRDYDPKYYRSGGVARIPSMNYETVKELVDKGFLDLSESQNLAPTTKVFMDFVLSHGKDNWIFHGYAVSPERTDCRVTIEGIESTGPLTSKDLIDFLMMFRRADELDADDNKDGSAYCWYD